MPEAGKIACVICGNVAGLMCQRCGEPYCNDECQRQDWQRHKYFCIIMPPLIAHKALKSDQALRPLQAPAQASNVESKVEQLSLVDKSSTTRVVAPLSSNWRDHFLPPEGGDFFECRVTFLEDNGIIWVVSVANTESLELFTDKMMKAMLNRKPCGGVEDIPVDSLVGVTVEEKIYRAQVVDLNRKLQQAEVRLIDYGAVLTIPLVLIYLPVPRMAEVNAYAYRVKLPTNTGVQINKILSLRLLGTKTHDGVYQVQLKPKMTIPLSLPVEMLQMNPEVKLIKIFQRDLLSQEPYVGLLQLKVLQNLNEDLNKSLKDKPGQLVTEPFPDGEYTFCVAALTKLGYRRAFLLDFIEKPTASYLVYEMDEGRVSIVHELRRIPSELLGHPLRVCATTLSEKQDCSGRDLTLKFKSENLQIKDKEKLRKANATLLSNGEAMCEVRVSTFFGQVSDLGLQYWRDPIKNGDPVYITCVHGYGQVSISSVDNKQYAEHFKNLDDKCKPFADTTQIPVGCVVLVVCPNLGRFRGEITGSKNGQYLVLNIDKGSEHQVAPELLRMSCRFIENLPVSLARIKLKTIGDIPSVAAAPPENNAAIHQLKKLSAKEETFNIDFVDSSCSVADLLSSSDQQSLVMKLLPLTFQSVSGKEKPTTDAGKEPPTQSTPIRQAESVPPEQVKPLKQTVVDQENAIERIYFNDLADNLIPTSDKLETLIISADGLRETGYITACYFPNEKVAETFQNVLDMVVHYGQCDHNAVPGYMPEVGEVCVALFADDQGWYRGVCKQIIGQKAEINYFDFGNTDMVDIKNLKPIAKDLLQGVYTTKCYISGFDKSKNFRKLEEYLARKGKIICGVQENPEPNARTIIIPNMEQIIS